MQFTAALAVLAVSTVASAASLVPRQTVDCIVGTKGIASERSFVFPLTNACVNQLKASGKAQDPYSNAVCVATAVVASPKLFRDRLSCEDGSLPAETAFPNLDYNIYASIVGDCAWAPDGCDVTRQNLIDLIYGAIGTAAEPIYPDVNDVTKFYIDPLFNWTATADSHTPYLNFNDWLHFAGRVYHSA